MGYVSSVAVSCGVGCRCGSDPALLWLWRRPVATAVSRPLAWEPPYAAGVALEKREKKKTKKKVKLSLCGVPLWLSGLRIWFCHHCGSGYSYSTGSTPRPGTSACHGCGQKEKLSMCISRNVAWIPCCCGCDVGWQLQLQLDPLAWEPPYAMGAALEKTKKDQKNPPKN